MIRIIFDAATTVYSKKNVNLLNEFLCYACISLELKYSNFMFCLFPRDVRCEARGNENFKLDQYFQFCGESNFHNFLLY